MKNLCKAGLKKISISGLVGCVIIINLIIMAPNYDCDKVSHVVMWVVVVLGVAILKKSSLEISRYFKTYR